MKNNWHIKKGIYTRKENSLTMGVNMLKVKKENKCNEESCNTHMAKK